jgi:hypothetical protein
MIQRESIAAARRIRRANLEADLKRYPQCAHVDKPLETQIEIARAWLVEQPWLGRLRTAAAYAFRAGVEADAMAAAMRELMPPRRKCNKRPANSSCLILIAPDG